MKRICIIFSLLFLLTGCKPKCPEDYILDNNICYKILETNAIINTEHYCYSGTLINDMCYPANSNMVIPAKELTPIIPGSYTYHCDYGYNLIGNMCYPIANFPATKRITSCPEGYTKNKSGIIGIEVPQIEVPGITLKCYKRITTFPK